MKILFVDPKSWTPYDNRLMREEGIGGTESSLVRIAHGLVRHHEIAVAQYARKEPAWIDDVHYMPLDRAPFGADDPDFIIVLRKHKLIPYYRRRFPASALYCWVHNWQPFEVILKRAWLARAGAGVICVSQSHRAHTDSRINGPIARLFGAASFGSRQVPVHCIYNPIDETLAPDETPVDQNRMIFLSTANKGLAQVLRNFTEVRRVTPAMELFIVGTRPEDMKRSHADCIRLAAQPGVHMLGRLPQHEMFAHLRRSLCVFYPQNMHPETFGLVFAEANAVGVPVLAHDFGAAREILGDPEQLVDARDSAAVAAKIAAWHEGGRPRVHGRAEFRTSAVIANWRHLIESGA